MRPRLSPAAALSLVTAFLLGCAGLAWGRWARPLLDAERALADGNVEAALQGYGVADARVRRLGPGRYLLSAEHRAAAYNQLALLYRAGDYETLLDKAATAPPSASPHFWAGSAWLSRAVAEPKPDARLAALSRAEDELKQALADDPDDWDAKFNYELAARLAGALRREPPKKSDAPMMLLRPQPPQTRTMKRTG